jgi:hypothetical protein
MSTTYAILLPGDEHRWAAVSPQERARVHAEHDRSSQTPAERGHTLVGGAELTHSRGAPTVHRASDGSLRVTDGPSAEAVGQLTGLYLVRPDDLDDLADVCGILAATGDAGEARAVVQPEGGQ